MQIRNITFMAPPASPAPVAAESEDLRLKLRTVAVSPHEEYLLRPGEVRPIANELAAAILSKKGRAEITLKGIVVDRVELGGRNIYWHEDSIVCNDLSARDRKIYYVLNPLLPDIVHLLTDQGAYIESLPLKFKPEVLNTDQQAAEVAKQNRQIGRAASRLQELHGNSTKERIAELQANSREMQRVVQTLPAPCTPGAPPMQPARSAVGEQVAAGARRINDMRANQASALALGRAITLNRRHAAPTPDTTPAEDWSDSPRHNNHNTPTTPVESW
jgi:hypothetical protein